jgi:hypothetical protein
VKKILAVDEGKGAFYRGFIDHSNPLKKVTPPEALRQVGWGANIFNKYTHFSDIMQYISTIIK